MIDCAALGLAGGGTLAVEPTMSTPGVAGDEGVGATEGGAGVMGGGFMIGASMGPVK